MAPVTNGRRLYNQTPTGYPEPGKTTVYDKTETIDLDTTPLSGGFLVKTLDLSVDPYMRDRMHDGTGHTPPYTKGKPIDGLGVGVVLRSESANVKAGDHVYGFFPYQEYWVASSQVLNQMLWILENKEKLPWSVYLGAAGMPGQTAYASWKEFANAKKGEVVFVSTGAGAVGSFVIQLAKADGLKVIASAGTDEKVTFMKSLGADVAFNYKTTSYFEVLAKEGPVDIYFDNVGGEALDAALLHSAHNARFLECGMISTLNTEAPPVKNLLHIIAKEIRVYGFVLTSLFPKYAQAFMSEIPARIASGEIKYAEDVTEGLENAGQAIRDVQTGRNKGKSIVRVARE